MSPLSSDTLFHFTNRRDHLISILEQEFRPHYALEDFSIVFGAVPGASDWSQWGVPCVCFCDIPLSQAASHMADYGEYALGLTKQWGIDRGITPVTYAHASGPLIQSLNRLFGSTDGGKSQVPQLFLDVLPFIKPYEGPYWHRGAQRERIRFYDEREWRFVPPNWASLPVLDKEDYLDDALRTAANTKLREATSPLGFDPWDIKYIVVSRENEIGSMIGEIHRIKSPKYSQAERDLLVTRLISAEQIRRDF